MQYNDAEEDEGFSELDPDMHTYPEHRWDISTMTVKEASASWKSKAVKAAMEEEIRNLVCMGTWELVERPPGVNIMKNWWVLTTKYHIDDIVEREKARLVVKGFTQVYGADYDETYAPVSSYVTLRIFLSIVAVLDLNLMQLDMKNAFLQSKLDRSPLLWYRALDDVLLGARWKKSQVNTVLYFKVSDVKVTCWVLVYVDDLLAASSSVAMLKELKELLEATFELREISPVQKYLGLEIVRNRSVRKLWLHQQGYADKMHRRFLDEEQNGRTPKTPISVDAYATLTVDDEEAQVRQEEEYRQKVGTLHTGARSTAASYLTNTRDTALEFGSGAVSLKLVGYVDADDKQNRTSTGDYVFVFGGAAVSWSSQRIKCATLSLTESEYVAATEAGKEGRHLRYLLAEFRQLDVGTPTVLQVDNKSAITLAEGMGLTGSLKHMERRQAWLQHMVKRGKFSLKYIPTAEQPADFLTKTLHYPAFNRCSLAIGQVHLVDMGDVVLPSGLGAQVCTPQGSVNGSCCWPRPRLGRADLGVGCEECSRPATVGKMVDGPGRPAQGPLQGRRLWEGANFGWSTWEVDQRRLVELGGRPVEGIDLGDADQGKPTWCGRLTGVLVDLELVDQVDCRPGVGRPGELSTW
ncbi:unnamed protein product [Closterium sp. NIES-53]